MQNAKQIFDQHVLLTADSELQAFKAKRSVTLCPLVFFFKIFIVTS